MTGILRALSLSLLLLPGAAMALDDEDILAWLDREQE